MVKSGIWAAALLVSVVFFVGCSDSPAPLSLGLAPQTVIEGFWVGQGNVTGGTMAPVGRKFELSMMVSQVGNGVTGKVMNDAGSEFDLAGSVNGRNFTFTLTQGKPCAGTFSGSGAAMNGDTELIGSYSGTDCRGAISADFKTAIKAQTEHLRIRETTRRQE